MQNTNSASYIPSKAVECTDVVNDNSVLSKMERIYSKQRLLYVKLLEINSAMIGSEVCDIPEVKTNCVMGYLDETDGILNAALDFVNDILHTIR